MKNIIQRGRVLGNGNSEFTKILEGGDKAKTFTLKSGKQATFVHSVILSHDIEKQTYVDSAINGRDQSMLTPDSVSDISRTIKLQQFFPAIGREVEGRIEILDGSRRRAACIFNETRFEVLVTKEEIDLSDARQLAADIQTAREHTLRELGKRFELMYSNGLTQADIAKAEGISPAKVTRAFQAASVPDEMMSVFPQADDLSIADYQMLLKIRQDAEEKNVTISEVVSGVRERIEHATGAESDASLDKAQVLAHFSAVTKVMKKTTPPGVSKRPPFEKLGEFEDKKQYARKKSDQEKRIVVYEFCRFPSGTQAEIDEAIKAIIDRMPGGTKNE